MTGTERAQNCFWSPDTDPSGSLPTTSSEHHRYPLAEQFGPSQTCTGEQAVYGARDEVILFTGLGDPICVSPTRAARPVRTGEGLSRRAATSRRSSYPMVCTFIVLRAGQSRSPRSLCRAARGHFARLVGSWIPTRPQVLSTRHPDIYFSSVRGDYLRRASTQHGSN